jgi:hypothetical protein
MSELHIVLFVAMAIGAAVQGSRSAAGQPAAANGLLGAAPVPLGTVLRVPFWACGRGFLCQIEGRLGVAQLKVGGVFHERKRRGCNRASHDGQDQ